MIIEKIPHGAIPYRCTHCESIYLWTPLEEDGFCEVLAGRPKCEKSDCEYFEMDPEVRCPFCKNRYDQKRISAFRYKIVRRLKEVKHDG